MNQNQTYGNDKDKDKDKVNDAKKASMKELRIQRKPIITKAAAIMKAQKKEMTAIKDFLKVQAATIPDIAAGTDMPTDKTLWYMATMKKYGQIVEGQKQGAFFLYSLEQTTPQEKAEV
jgi:hypothetical protein